MMQRYEYQLTCLSPIILSPRGQSFFTTTSKENPDKKVIIYPFYQYGTYDTFNEKGANYYIPGSSIKGAICSKKRSGVSNIEQSLDLAHTIMVDDISILSKDLEIKPLWKLQDIPKDGISSNKKIKYKRFFGNVSVQMLKKDSNQDIKRKGVMYAKGDIREYLKDASSNAEKLLKGYCTKLRELNNMSVDRKTMMFERLRFELSKGEQHDLGEKEAEIEFDKIYKQIDLNINTILGKQRKSQDTYLLILGGYKGLVLAGVLKEAYGGFYIDKDTLLPYGIVQIKLNRGEKDE